MPDMLVKLYELPPVEALLKKLKSNGIAIRPGLAPEKRMAADWVAHQFGSLWASECEVGFARQPVSCFIALKDEAIVGFACYDTTYRNFFGPTGVSEAMRGQGVGKALLLVCLHAMAQQGYAYAIIGDAGPGDFYSKAVGAIPIAGSTPGIYKGMMRET